MFWGVISYEFCSKLAFIDGYMNSEKYTGMLKSHLEPMWRYLDKDDTIFQQDNAPCVVIEERGAQVNETGVYLIK